MTTSSPHFIPASQARESAGRAASKILPDEVGETRPFPRREGDTVVLMVLYYWRSGSHPTARPPHYALTLDPTSGQVVDLKPCYAAELGIRTPTAPIPEVVGPKDVKSFIAHETRWLAIASDVWSAFAANDHTSAACDLAREYWALFTHMEHPDVAPFYVDASPDFFAYLRSCDL